MTSQLHPSGPGNQPGDAADLARGSGRADHRLDMGNDAPLSRGVGPLRRWLRDQLARVSPSADLDSRVLLAHVLDRPASWILAHPEAMIRPDQLEQLGRVLARILSGTPLPYVIGHWEFFGLPFEVTPAVLIPRPETELLVETALDWLRAHPGRRRSLEIGAGSGCIAISLARRLSDLQVIASDISGPALHVASRNARKHGVASQIQFVQCNLAEPIRGPFDLICANLPYIPAADLRGLPVYGHEPTMALDGGPVGLSLIGPALQDLKRLLAADGLALFEIEASQGATASSLARKFLPDLPIQILSDLAGRDRLLVIGSLL